MSQSSYSPRSLKKQCLVITGASSGIGLATARMAAKRGAKVVLAARNLQELEKVVAEIHAAGGQAIAVDADVKSEADLRRVREKAIAAFGGIDTWVNNAGLSVYGHLLDLSEREERELFETNFWGVRHGCHVATEAMKQRGGVIINLGSEVSQRAVPLQGIYSASKHAVKAYTDALRMELEHDGLPIAVSLIRPTAIDTPFPLHARNRLRDGEPSLPSPMYKPEVVAEAILACAEKPRRDVYVGGSSRVFGVLDVLFPRMLDLLMESKMFKEQSEGSAGVRESSEGSLEKAPRHEGQTQPGPTSKRVRGTSLYTTASLHPWATAMLLGASAALLMGASGWLAGEEEQRAA